jgi:hypothetical protein
MMESAGLRVIHGSGPPPVGRAKTRVGYFENALAAGLPVNLLGSCGGRGERSETDVWQDVVVGIYFPEPELGNSRAQRELLLLCNYVSA